MFDFDRIKQNAFAAIAAILFSATMISAAVGPAHIGSTAPAAAARA
jgi:hypothetical protein